MPISVSAQIYIFCSFKYLSSCYLYGNFVLNSNSIPYWRNIDSPRYFHYSFKILSSRNMFLFITPIEYDNIFLLLSDVLRNTYLMQFKIIFKKEYKCKNCIIYTFFIENTYFWPCYCVVSFTLDLISKYYVNAKSNIL